ncbi:hypothetical protein KDW54_28355 [Burkholderia ambifaria]|uniref:hypothetical protein n=1 Tax=Burkholderia ambifaria TaxID=152480 RepID=UPI001BA055C9|nr:hypothetical protein [Burkholderia ambifaria]MBR8186307.1 hypothetical protein [Burkholderia ambifaria]
MTAPDGTTPPAAQSDDSPPYIERGSRNDSRASVAVLFAGFVSIGASRHWLMTMSLLLSSLLTLVAAFTPR